MPSYRPQYYYFFHHNIKMNFVKISNIVSTKEGAISFLIIPKEMVCSGGHAMSLSLGIKDR